MNRNLRGYKSFPLSLVVIIWLMVYLTDSQLFVFNQNRVLSSIAEYSIVFLSIVVFIVMALKNRKVFSTEVFVAILACVWLGFVGLIHGEFSGGYISKISLILLGVSFFTLFPREQFRDAYISIFRFIFICSLVGVLFSAIILQIGFIPVITNTSGANFKCMIVTNVSYEVPYRNFGPFTEPSRYQAFINLFIIFVLFGNKNTINWLNFSIGIITLITTFSTTGFISLSMILIAFFMQKRKGLSIWLKISLFFCIIFSTIILLKINENFLNSINKLSKGLESSSFTVRYNSIVASIRIILQNPVFGTGIKNNQAAFEKAVSAFSNNSEYINTNTVLLTFAKFGSIFGAFYLYHLIKSIRCFASSLSAVMLFLSFFFMLSGISMLDSAILNIFIFYHCKSV